MCCGGKRQNVSKPLVCWANEPTTDGKSASGSAANRVVKPGQGGYF